MMKRLLCVTSMSVCLFAVLSCCEWASWLEYNWNEERWEGAGEACGEGGWRR